MRNQLKRTQAKQTGFTLVELMIAVALSAILLNGVIQLFVSSKQSYRVADGLGRMQETARYALDVLAQDIRQAGFLPCRISKNSAGIDQVANVLNDNDGKFDFFGTPIQGFEGSVSTFPAEFPVVGSTPANRLAGSDGLRLLKGGSDVYSVVSHNPPSAQFKLNASHSIEDGDILLVCDHENASIFQVTNANQANVTIVHNSGTGTPGNCSKFLGYAGPGDCNVDDHAYGTGSQVVSFDSIIYYIGPSLSNEDSGRNIPDTNSLYRRSLGNNNGTNQFGAAQELVEGIETMQIVYGVAATPNGAAIRYTSANNIPAAEWANVVSVRIGLLLHTPEEVADTNDTRSYGIVGTSVSSQGTVSYPTDRRQRYVFSETIQIRNRGAGITFTEGRP